MNDGMKIILERMKTHPEEFKDDNKPFAYDGKWIGLISDYENNLPEEDMKAFKEAIDAMRQEEFTAKVMEELLDPKSEQLELNLVPRQPPLRMQQVGQTLGISTNGNLTTLTSNTNSLTLGNTTIEEAQLKAMKAHVESLQVKDRDKLLKKPHKTIFGRLFNYT